MQNGIESINYEQIMNTPEIDNARKEGYREGFEHGRRAGRKDTIKAVLELLGKKESEYYFECYIDYAKVCAQIRASIYDI
jgi:flagellar biosynthesis/type III secretory pathway protein FliH